MAANDTTLAPSSRRSRSVEVEVAVVADGDPAQLDAELVDQLVPRDDVGVVLELGEHDGVAGPQVGPAPRLGHQVERLGGVLGEHDLAVGAGADEAGDLGPGALERGGGLLGDEVDAPVDVGVGRARSSARWRRARPGASATCWPSRGRRAAARAPRRSRIGKSFLMRSTSSSVGGRGSGCGHGVVASDCDSWCRLGCGAPALVALALEPLGQLGAAAVDDAAVDEDVDPVGLQVVEQALVVGDDQDAQLGTVLAHLIDTVGHDLERVDVEAGVGLVEDGDLGLEDGHLQDLVALLLAAREALVEVAVGERRVHVEPLHPVHDRQPQLEHRQVDALAGRQRLAQEVDDRDARDRPGGTGRRGRCRPCPARRCPSR